MRAITSQSKLRDSKILGALSRSRRAVLKKLGERISKYLNLMHHKSGSSIAHGRVAWIFHLIGLRIIKELEIHTIAIAAASFHLSNHVEKDPNWMTTTDGVSKPFQVAGKPRSIKPLNKVHALFVKSLDVLVDVTRLLIVLGVAEPLTPVTEVRGYHKAVGRIL